MNILLLTPFNPYPPVQGGKIRIFNIIKHLSRNHKISLVSIVDNAVAEDIAPLLEICDEVVLVERPARLWRDRLHFLTGNKAYNVIRYASNELYETLRRLLKKKSFDLVQIEFSMMYQYAPLFNGIPVILDAHNIEYAILHEIGKTFRNPIKRLSYMVEERRFKRMEHDAWLKSSLCMTVSEKERGLIASVTERPDKVITIPNGVDTERFSFEPNQTNGKSLLFIGGLDYMPNLDSAKYLLNEIFPVIRSVIPDSKLTIAGRELWRIRDYCSGIDLNENIPDIVPFFRQADVLLVPLRIGAGTRIKILEAMAAGLPVVTTSKGCEGIDVINREHLMIADTPSDFAQAVEEVLADADLRASLTENARKLIESGYSWEKLVKKMENSYAAISN